MTVRGETVGETHPVFILYEMEHGQRLAQFAERTEALAALERVQKRDPDNAALYGVRQIRRGRPVGDYITTVETAAVPTTRQH